MGYYYKFYDPHGMKLIDEGKFAGMPFYNNEIEVPMVFGRVDTFGGSYEDPYDAVGILNKEMAIEIQKSMTTNETIFTDWMKDFHTDILVFTIT